VLRDGSTLALRDARDTDLAALTAFVKRFRRMSSFGAARRAPIRDRICVDIPEQ
jgi:hypothetical protein